MDRSLLIKPFSQLRGVATSIGDAALRTGHAANEAAHTIDWMGIGNNINEITINTAMSAARAYENAEQVLRSIKCGQIGRAAGEAIKDNPQLVLIPAGIAAGAVTGGLLMGPALGAAGFSSIGPVAGTLASGIQSAGLAGSVFSFAQSAAMGGYGVATVATCFTGAGAVAGGAVAAAAGVSHSDESNSLNNVESDGFIGTRQDKGDTDVMQY